MADVKHYRKEWYIANLLLFGIVLLASDGVCHGYDMEFYCDEEFSFILKDEQQIELKMDDNYIYDRRNSIYSTRRTDKVCETKFEAWYSYYSYFMIYFDDLDLDCSDGHLEFYSGESGQSRVNGLEADICGSSKPDGVYTIKDRYFRIRYVPKRRQYITDIFTVVITAYGTGYCPSYGHTCSNGRCIDDDIVCNGYNSCGDNSSCDLSTGAIIGIAVGGVAGLAIVVSAIICCVCCAKRTGMRQGTTVQNTGAPVVVYSAQNQNRFSQPMYGVNQPMYGVNYNIPPGQQQPVTIQNQGTPYPASSAMYPTVPSDNNINNQSAAGTYNVPS
ncbi:uncharacterized protein LOC132737014 [Ruditapes philippinarum]|uniref:uncharacterized protein LOC132737014 n=1 Tax=Ruditapes philippinarum TaxID=129788 RepID=UPI00295C31E4|nr:uncharacterized protein LOC132737014 [Ruditapes philippinarum]